MPRILNLDVPDLPNEQHVAWLTANGIDPSDVPAAQEVHVADNQIHFLEFERGADGHRLPIHDDNGEAVAWRKVAKTLPLLSSLKNHGL